MLDFYSKKKSFNENLSLKKAGVTNGGGDENRTRVRKTLDLRPYILIP